MIPSVSVVIPTLNAADRIASLLSALLSQTVRPQEVLVVDSSSDDATVEIAESFEGVRVKVIDRSTFNHGITRHEALLDTRGEIVCFMTDDAEPTSDEYIANLIEPLNDLRVAMVSGRQLPKPDARRYEQLIREFNYSSESNVRSKEDLPRYGIKTFFATDVCSAYRREAYLEVGGFERVNTNEDMLMAARFISSGYKVAYAANATVLHSHNLSFKQQYLRNKEVGFFLQNHAADLAGAGEIGEGTKLAKTVSVQLLKEAKVLEFIAFGLDCVARFAGNRAGRKKARK